MQTPQILSSLHKQHGLGNKSRFARFEDLQKYDLSESRKKEVIKHTKVDIEQKEVHDYLPGLEYTVRLMKTQGGVFHFYVNCIEFYVNWMQMVETRSALMQD